MHFGEELIVRVSQSSLGCDIDHKHRFQPLELGEINGLSREIFDLEVKETARHSFSKVLGSLH